MFVDRGEVSPLSQGADSECVTMQSSSDRVSPDRLAMTTFLPASLMADERVAVRLARVVVGGGEYRFRRNAIEESTAIAPTVVA